MVSICKQFKKYFLNGVIIFLGKNDVIMVTLFGHFRGFSDMADCFLGGEDCCVNNATYRTMRDTWDDEGHTGRWATYGTMRDTQNDEGHTGRWHARLCIFTDEVLVSDFLFDILPWRPVSQEAQHGIMASFVT